MRDRERAGEVRDEDEARLERCDEQWVPPLVVEGELVSELANAGGDLLAREVDVADARVD